MCRIFSVKKPCWKRVSFVFTSKMQHLYVFAYFASVWTGWSGQGASLWGPCPESTFQLPRNDKHKSMSLFLILRSLFRCDELSEKLEQRSRTLRARYWPRIPKNLPLTPPWIWDKVLLFILSLFGGFLNRRYLSSASLARSKAARFREEPKYQSLECQIASVLDRAQSAMRGTMCYATHHTLSG